MKADSISEISILVPRLIPIVTFAPYLNELYRRGIRVHAYGPAEVLSALAREVPSDGLVLHDWSAILERRKWQQFLHSWLTFALTPSGFSLFWPRFVEASLTRYKGLKQLVMRLALWLPLQVAPNRVNHWVELLCKPFSRNPFATSCIVATTAGGGYHLLVSRGLKKVSILESWDQPTKHPIGYVPDVIHTWSTVLKRDWERNQGALRVVAGYPTKLNYLLNREEKKVSSRSMNVWMYPAAFCLDSIDCYYQEECRLIRVIAEVTSTLGVKLLVKPKPNGTPGEFDAALKGFTHVQLGAYQEHRNKADYLLTDEYNATRCLELEACDLLINFGTTFAYEGAMMSRPVLQLMVTPGGDYPALAKITQNYHLQEYLLKDKSMVQSFSVDRDLAEILGTLNNPDSGVLDQAIMFSQHLMRFIQPEMSLQNAVVEFADDCERGISTDTFTTFADREE